MCYVPGCLHVCVPQHVCGGWRTTFCASSFTISLALFCVFGDRVSCCSGRPLTTVCLRMTLTPGSSNPASKGLDLGLCGHQAQPRFSEK